jgi:3-phosphoshikimate 1-carboxyvinyltransferase
MNAIAVQPVGRVDAVVRVPGSKSLTNRALSIAALADGESALTGCLFSDDTRCMIDSLRLLGVRIEDDRRAETVRVVGCNGRFPDAGGRLYVGNAGTAMRFLTAACAAAGRDIRIDGNERMRQRPIAELAAALRALGAEFPDGLPAYPPVALRGGGLAGGRCRFTDPQSSQYVSAVLMAAPLARRPVEVEVVGDLVSEPYVTMTVAVMRAFAATVERAGNVFAVPAPQTYRGRTYAVEPDASSASYFTAIAAVTGGRVRVEGLGVDSCQGDARFVDVLERMGCTVTRRPAALEVRGPTDAPLRGVDVNLSDMPDMAQTLAAVALFARGPTTIRGVANLRIKETDRIAALYNELGKLGAAVEVLPDGLSITPPERIAPARIAAYDDHRMAMSFAVVGAAAPGIVIEDPGCVSKTFPDFFDRLGRLNSGFEVRDSGPRR